MRLSIRLKLFLGLFAMVLLAGMIAITAISRLSKITEVSVELVDEAIPEVHLLSEMTHLISTMDRDLERLLLLSPDAREAGRAVREKEKRVGESLAAYEKFHPVPPPEIEQGLGEFKPRHAALEKTSAEIRALAQQRQTHRGRALLAGKWKEHQRATLDSLNRLMNFEDEEARRDANLIQDESRSGRKLMINLAGVGIFLGLAVAFWINSAVAKPIRRLVTATERVSQGDLASRAEIKREDEIGHLARRFNEMVAQLSKSLEDQRRFYADASHELRTPLTAIRGVAEVALRGPEKSPGEHTEALRSIVELATEMGRLVDDLLFLARSEAGQLQYEMAEVSLAPLLEEVIDQTRGLASSTERRIELAPETTDRPVVWGDAQRLRQLFLILMDNAIKYTDPGGKVTLSIRPEPSWVRILVHDNGIGISENDIPHIFERFYRADATRARSEASTGLGLSIAQSIVKGHKGNISVESTVGRGATFSVLFPRFDRKDKVA